MITNLNTTRRFCALVAAVVSISGVSVASAQITTKVDVSYTYQRFNNWCGSASVQMILSSPAVRNNNGFVNFMLNAPDAPGVPGNGVRQQPTYGTAPGSFGNNVLQNPQAAIYNLNHGLATLNGLSYLNPFIAYGSGSDTLGMATALNYLDNPAFIAQGKHSYTAWNFPAGVAGAALATKQIANSIKLTNVAAQAGIGGGTHAICVSGVTTDIAIAPNTDYKITGVIVQDPWSGFYDQQIAAGFGSPGGGRGFGANAWVPNGYDFSPVFVPGMPVINVPGVGLVQGRFKKWLKAFNTSPATPGTGPVFSVPGTQFITASSSIPNNVASIPLEVGGGNNFFGLVGKALLPAPIANAAAAVAQAGIQLAANNGLNNLPQFQNGNFNLAAAQFVPDPNPILPGDGDWIVPFLPNAGAEFTGSINIDALTGDIDLGIWSATDTYTSDELLGLTTDLINDIYPESGLSIPEPSSLGALAPAALLLSRRRRT